MAVQGREINGRLFRTSVDYQAGLRDKDRIDAIKNQTDLRDVKQVKLLIDEIDNGTYRFETLLGEDFLDELIELEKNLKNKPPVVEKKQKSKKAVNAKQNKSVIDMESMDDSMRNEIMKQLHLQEKKRKSLVFLFGAIALACLIYVGGYYFFYQKNDVDYKKLAQLKDKDSENVSVETPYTVTYTDETDAPPVLEKYKTLLNKNKRLIGWLKIDDTNIDYPVMQTENNEYYLDHNFNQEYDKNGSLFLDKDCDIVNPNINMIIYGHHMKSGKMFGNLNYYSKESYYKEHPRIYFDTIYEEGVYEIMFVFRSRIYNEEDIVFKYYQFIDVNSEDEFNSAMEEMRRMSLYDTGVSAVYGDRLITLSTCDNSETDGRFVVVAKRVR